jgi:hypothetical protein
LAVFKVITEDAAFNRAIVETERTIDWLALSRGTDPFALWRASSCSQQSHSNVSYAENDEYPM